MSAEAFVLPNNVRRWAGRRDRARFEDGTDASKECVRPAKHKEGDCIEVTVKLPVVDTNAIEILSLVHILQIYRMSAMFPVKSMIWECVLLEGQLINLSLWIAKGRGLLKIRRNVFAGFCDQALFQEFMKECRM